MKISLNQKKNWKCFNKNKSMRFKVLEKSKHLIGNEIERKEILLGFKQIFPLLLKPR